MPRFYVDFALSPDSVVELPDNVVRHLNVLRVKNTEEIVLFNGNGKAYPALPEVLENAAPACGLCVKRQRTTNRR